MTRTKSPASSGASRACLATSLLLAASVMIAGCCGTKRMPAPELRYQENLLVMCEIRFPTIESDELDEAMRNHLSVVEKARECARRHNNLVEAMRKEGQAQ